MLKTKMTIMMVMLSLNLMANEPVKVQEKMGKIEINLDKLIEESRQEDSNIWNAAQSTATLVCRARLGAGKKKEIKETIDVDELKNCITNESELRFGLAVFKSYKKCLDAQKNELQSFRKQGESFVIEPSFQKKPKIKSSETAKGLRLVVKLGLGEACEVVEAQDVRGGIRIAKQKNEAFIREALPNITDNGVINADCIDCRRYEQKEAKADEDGALRQDPSRPYSYLPVPKVIIDERRREFELLPGPDGLIQENELKGVEAKVTGQ